MRLLPTLLIILILPFITMAQPSETDAARFFIDNGQSSMSIEGGSTVGSWDADVQIINAEFSIDLEALESNGSNPSTVFQLGSFTVPVENIDGDGRRLTRNIHNYLNKDDHPEITFTMNSSEIVEKGENGYKVEVNGVINAAGKDHEVVFTADVMPTENGGFLINGKLPLKFSDFNIDRPSAMLGTVRADEDIEIHYNLVLMSR